MNRRELLKLILSGAIGHTLDVDRLLWVPGAKKIFIPSIEHFSIAEIVAIEYERMLPHIRTLFERDDTFYQIIKNGERSISGDKISVPLILGDKE